MKALVLARISDLKMQDIPAPEPAPDELLIKVFSCGICGSDVHGYDGSSGRRIPPLVMGHEASGIVAGMGSAVTGFSLGERVTFDSTVYCGRCAFCIAGDVNLCDSRQVLGVSCGEYRRAGAFAEYLTVPSRIAYHLPDELSFPEAAMLEAVSVALHGVAVSGPVEGKTVLVVGAGMIGLLLLQAARAEGAARVFVSDIDRSRLALAAELGAEETFLASDPALLQEIQARTQGQGVDLVLGVVAVGIGAGPAVVLDGVVEGLRAITDVVA